MADTVASERVNRFRFTQTFQVAVETFCQTEPSALRACSKPHRREFARVVLATGAGFRIIGFLGFFVKLVWI